MFLVNEEYDARKKERIYRRKLELLRQVSEHSPPSSAEELVDLDQNPFTVKELGPVFTSSKSVGAAPKSKVLTRMRAMQLAKVFIDKLKMHRLASVTSAV